MNKKLLFLVFVLVFLVPAVLADGICELDKFDYNPGGTGTFSCSCDTATEANKAGYVVWQNDTSILQVTAVNSGSCQTSFFGDSYTFLSGANYSGNVTFSLNADGTGIPTNWNQATDVIDDTWNVSGADVFDCLINGIVGVPDGYDLGRLGSVKFVVSDASSGNPLVHVGCQVDGYNVDGTPILFEPYVAGESIRYSVSGGEVGFQHLMSESVWVVDTSYLFEFHCFCLPNSTHGHDCYDEVTGLNAGFKSCNVQALFTTGSGDYRNEGNILGIILALIAVIVGYGVAGYFCLKLGGVSEDKTSFWFGIFCFGIAISEFIFMTGVLFLNELGWNLAELLKMHFYIMLILSFGVSFTGLVLIVIRILKCDDEDKKSTKW